MNKKLIVLILLLACVNVFAQQTVKLTDVAGKVIEKGLEGIDPTVYQGGTFVYSLVNYALATGAKEDIDRVKSILDQFKDGKIKMNRQSNFISYAYGGNAAAKMAFRGFPEYKDMVLQGAADAWTGQRRTATDGLMTGNRTRPHQKDVFFVDVVSAITPYFTYAGLLSGNPEYYDYAAWETLKAYEIFKDSQTGLFHQCRGTYDVPDIITEDNWSRGNGWASNAFTALLLHLPKSSKYYRSVRMAAKEFFTAVLKYQDPQTGLWRQEMSDPSSYIETSGSGYLLEGLGAAIQSGVISKKHKADFLRGVQGLLMYVDPDGSVGHTCRGCLSPGNGTKTDYMDRQFYFNESHAFGPVVTALAAAIVMGYDEVELPAVLGSANDADRPATYVRFIEERKEDFAWENDLAAFRVYSRFAGDGTASGVDFWSKCVDYPIINDWYAHSVQGRSYHKYYGQGADFYTVGKGRGVGGTGVWVDGKLYCSKNYANYKIVRNDKDRIEFILYYQPFKAGDRIIQETKRIEMVCGTNFYKVTATFEAQDGGEVIVAAGVTTFGQAEMTKDAARGLVWANEHIKNKLDKPMCDAHSFSAVVVEPSRLVDMVSYESDELALFKAASGEEVVFFAGGGWQYHQKNSARRSEPYRESVSWQQLIEVYSGKRPAWEFPHS